MRDGVILRADVLRPKKEGAFPVLVYRTPYGKHFAREEYKTFEHAVARGYAVVIQDVRGRYKSDGEFRAYENEGRDGYDTIEWAAKAAVVQWRGWHVRAVLSRSGAVAGSRPKPATLESDGSGDDVFYSAQFLFCHVGPVHLLQPDGRRRQERLHATAVFRDCRDFRKARRSGHGTAKIERCASAGADAAVTCRDESAHAWWRFPCRDDPVDTHRAKPLGERTHRCRIACGSNGHGHGPDTAASARSVVISAARSAGGGASHDIVSRVAGWTRPSRVACSACRAKAGHARRAPAPVRRIADERMADRGEMHANLVRAAGLERAAQERRHAEALDDADVRARRLALGDDRHRRALRRMAADRRVDDRRARRRRRARRQGIRA